MLRSFDGLNFFLRTSNSVVLVFLCLQRKTHKI